MNERIKPFLYGRPLYESLGRFVEERFEKAGRRMTPEAVDVLLGLGQSHPYSAHQLAFHTFRLLGEKPTDEETIFAAKDAVLTDAESEFRAILDTMERPRRAVLVALCKEPST